MASYLFRCRDCGDVVEEEHPIGTAPRHRSCTCGQQMKLLIGVGVQVAPSALENKGQQVRDADAREQRWNKDIPAYERMRVKGMQPAGINGSAVLEDKVGDQIDIDYGRFYKDGVTRNRVLESKEQAEEIMKTGVPMAGAEQ